MGVLQRVAKHVARLLLGDYSVYRLYRCADADASHAGSSPDVREIDAALVSACGDPLLAEQAWYCGADSQAFGAFDDERLRAVCFYWWGERYRRERAFIALGPGEAKLVQIVTSPSARGRGLARGLIIESTRRMHARGMSTLYARVWHSNHPSRQAFEGAGWQPAGWVVDINPLRRAQPWRIRWGSSPASARGH